MGGREGGGGVVGKALAESNFLKVVSSAIVDKYIGESARVIREMFGYAKCAGTAGRAFLEAERTPSSGDFAPSQGVGCSSALDRFGGELQDDGIPFVAGVCVSYRTVTAGLALQEGVSRPPIRSTQPTRLPHGAVCQRFVGTSPNSPR